jgi:hypothetical protein
MSRTPRPDVAARRVANLEQTVIRRGAAVASTQARLARASASLKAALTDLKAARAVLKTLEGGEHR